MTKPEDIPQWAWQAAEQVVSDAAAEVVRLLRTSDEAPDDLPEEGVFEPLIARAIFDAVEEEREACARMAYDAARPHAREFSRKRLEGRYRVAAKPLALQALAIAKAIRKRATLSQHQEGGGE